MCGERQLIGDHVVSLLHPAHQPEDEVRRLRQCHVESFQIRISILNPLNDLVRDVEISYASNNRVQNLSLENIYRTLTE